jgi:hypothetical protein
MRRQSDRCENNDEAGGRAKICDHQDTAGDFRPRNDQPAAIFG